MENSTILIVDDDFVRKVLARSLSAEYSRVLTADDYLRKPVELNHLSARLKALLGRGQAPPTVPASN